MLLSRILAITCLVLAFAQPYFPAASNTSVSANNVASIFLDNSFSMNATNDNGTLLDDAKNKARELAKSYKSSDRFQLITNDFEGRQQRLVNKEEFLELLDEVEISPASKNLADAYSRQKEAVKDFTEGNRNFYFISDFQESISDVSNFTPDSSNSLFFIPIIANQENNLYIDSCWFKAPIRQLNQPEELIVRIKNVSAESYDNIPVKLKVNGEQKALASLSIGADEYKDVVMSYTNANTGIQLAELSITDYPITYDDVFYFSYNVASQIPVLSIQGKNASQSVNSLYSSDTYFKFHTFNENNINYSTFSDNLFIILNEVENLSSGLVQELLRFAENGGSILTIPAKKADINGYNELLLAFGANTISGIDSVPTKVSRIAYESDIFANVFQDKKENIDLPQVNKYYSFAQATRTTEERILTLANGASFLSRYSYEKGSFYVLSSPLKKDFNNFSRHAIFVPAMYNMALFSQSTGKLFYTIGKDEIVELPKVAVTAENIFKIKAPNSELEIIPGFRSSGSITQLMMQGQINTSGNYLLILDTDTLSGLSFNFDRKESDLTAMQTSDIEKEAEKAGLESYKVLNSQVKGIDAQLSDLSQGTKLWKLFILLALLFLAIEILLLKFWKG